MAATQEEIRAMREMKGAFRKRGFREHTAGYERAKAEYEDRKRRYEQAVKEYREADRAMHMAFAEHEKNPNMFNRIMFDTASTAKKEAWERAMRIKYDEW